MVELMNYPDGEIIRKEIIDGTQEKKTPQQISSSIGHRTGMWGLDDLISYYQAIAFETAKAAEIKDKSSCKDPIVYKWVHKQGCCELCIRLYLMDGAGSQPILYKLSELERNGSNEGRKHSEWKPTIYPTHKGCNCSLSEYKEGYLWSPANQSFSLIDPEYKRQTALTRALIRVRINGKEHFL